MVHLIRELHRKKGYRLETLYLAVSIADRYLCYLRKRAPCLVLLSVASLLLAAKLNEAMRPSFMHMNRLLHAEYNVFVRKDEFIALERDIVRSLQFSLQWVSPIAFLERFQRVFQLDREDKDEASFFVGELARDYCLVMLRNADFLQFRPSQIAAAAITMAIRTHYDTKFKDIILSKHDFLDETYDVMKMWTAEVEVTTKISVEDDLRPVYRLLKNGVNSLN